MKPPSILGRQKDKHQPLFTELAAKKDVSRQKTCLKVCDGILAVFLHGFVGIRER